MAGFTFGFSEKKKNSSAMGFTEDKNYHFKDDKAYTEDDILVYNIFVYKIPKKASQEETLKYFSQFGEVKRVRLVADKKRSRRSAPKVGFINFADPLAAAKVLKQNTPHIILSKRVSVKACDSWHQPEAQNDNISMDTDESETAIEKTSQPSILMLNDDCLEHIFKKLEIKEQVRLSRCCQRFRDVFEMVCKTEHKTHNVEKLTPLTLWETREFFKAAGSSMEELNGSVPYKDRERIVEFISNFCPNIKMINFNSSRLKSAVLKKLLDKLTNVTVLKLADCSLNDNAILTLKKLPKLEYLMVSNNYELTGKYMDRLKSVKELILNGCGNIQHSHFIEVCKSLKDLRSLDIQRCERLSANAFSEMVTNCVNLESLKIQSWSPVIQYECVARLPRLKNLEVLSSSLTAVRLELFNELAKHKANQLEYLKIVGKNCITYDRAKQISHLTSLKQFICSNNEGLTDDGLRRFADLQNLEEITLKQCRSITNDGLLALLRRCTKLKKVNIQYCPLITDQFVLKAIELFKSTQNQRSKEPCVFYVFKSGINTYMLNNAVYLAANNLIQLCFHVPTTRVEDESNENSDFSDEDDFDDDNFFSDELDEVDYDDPYDMFGAFSDQDDIEEEVILNAYNMFGRYANYGDDINDFMW